MADLSERAQEREIDGFVYRVWPIPMKPHGTAALVRLIKLVSPMLSQILRADTKEERAAALFESLPQALTEADVDFFARAFGDAAQYQNDKGEWAPLIDKTQAQHFAGRYFAYFRWIAFCAEVNYGNFFDGIKSVVASGALPAVMQK
jgi:hypothetical protein